MLGKTRRGNSAAAVWLLRWCAVSALLAGICLAIPQAASAQNDWPEGVPFKGASTSEIRWVENGASWHVPSMTVLRQCMGGDSRIQTISDSDFRQLKSAYPDGGNIGCPSYPDGTLYRAPYNPDVWVISNGRSWYAPNDATVNCWGGWGTVHWVSAGEAVRLRYQYPQAGTAACPLPNGYQFKGSDNTIWVMWGVHRYAEPSMQMYNQCVYQGFFQPYQAVSDATRDNWLAMFANGGTGWCSHAPRTEAAISWAQAQLGKSTLPDGWPADNSCDHFAALAYGAANSGYGSAYDHWQSLNGRGLAHPGDSAVPYGALAFFGPVSGNSYGHVMVSRGDGSFVSTGPVWWEGYADHAVHIDYISHFGNYLGWAWADSSYPGR